MKPPLSMTALAVALALLAIPAAAAADWDQAPITLPAGATGGFLSGADCVEAGSCVAVGDYYTSVDDQAAPKLMVVTETGGIWGQAVPVGESTGARLPNEPFTDLEDVSCPAAGSCVAVGYEEEAARAAYWGIERQPIVAVETDGAWGQAFPVIPPGGPYAILTSVSCPAAGSCVAVGGDESGPFAVGENGGTWGPAVQIPPTGRDPRSRPPSASTTSAVPR